MTSKLRILSVSDIHLGHPNTPTSHIIENLDRHFADRESMQDVDLLFIVGDLFDRAIGHHDLQAVEIHQWMRRLLKMAKRRDIVVRALEGTPSHDWRQNRWLEEVNREIGAQFKYVDVLSIEYIERFGINVLYVPDEWKPETDDVWKDVQQALMDHQLEQVDFTLIHGTFEFQLPAHVQNVPRHNPQRYLDITRQYIFAGHIHQSAQYERILSNGSFDRLSHGEEGPKGFWDVTIKPTGDEIVFVENTGAKQYRTYDCRGLTLDEALVRLESVRDLPVDSFVRIAAPRDDALLASLEIIRKTYPHVRWSVKTTDSKEVQKNLLVDLRTSFQQTNLTRSNLPDLLMQRVRSMTQDSEVLAQCETLLAETL